MAEQTTIILGIPIPSTSRVFLSIVLVHVIAGLGCVVGGLVAMFSEKQFGRHPFAGTAYYWCLAFVTVSMAALSAKRAG